MGYVAVLNACRLACLAAPLLLSTAAHREAGAAVDRATTPSLVLEGEEKAAFFGSFCFSDDSSRLAFIHDDGTVVVWNTRTGQRDGPPLEKGFKIGFFTNSFSVSGVGGGFAFDPTGRHLIWSFGKKIAVWDLKTGSLVLRREREGECCPTANSDGTLLAIDSDDGVMIWDVVKRVESGARLPGRLGAFSSDGRVLATLAGQRVMLWSLADRQLAGPPLEHDRDAWRVLFSRNDKLLGVLSRAPRMSGVGPGVTLWDIELRELKSPPLALNDVPGDSGGNDPTLAFSSDDRFFAATNRGPTHLWDLSSSGAPRSIPTLGGRLEFIASGLLTVGESVWDVARGTPERVHECSGLQVTRDGRTIVCRGKRDFTLWDLPMRATAAGPVLVPGQDDSSQAPVLSPDGRLLAIRHETRRRTWWEIKRRTLISIWDVERLRANAEISP